MTRQSNASWNWARADTWQGTEPECARGQVVDGVLELHGDALHVVEARGLRRERALERRVRARARDARRRTPRSSRSSATRDDGRAIVEGVAM